MNFLLMEMTHLRYWMPLVVEGNKRGIQSTFFVAASHKYNCPTRYPDALKEAQNVYNVKLLSANDLRSASEAEGIFFSSEKTGVNYAKKATKCKRVICTYQTDFIESYKEYKDFADHIIMPSKFCAEYYNLHTEKNLYLGIPKYEVYLDKQIILEKYNLPTSKKVLIIWPKARDENRVNIDKILNNLKTAGYTILVKTRGKDPLMEKARQTLRDNGDFYFEDDSWYPHTTQELLEVSDIVINFGSTTIEECVMHDTPIINFDIKPEVRNGSKRPYRVTHDYLYNYNYCVQLKEDFTVGQLQAAVNYLTVKNLTKEFKEARQNHLFDHKDSCKRILDVLL